MGSSLVPIMLIVVLLVGAVVFVVLSSRAPRTGYGSGRKRSLETRRSRPGSIPLRDAPEPSAPAAPDTRAPDPQSPDGVVPGFTAPASAPAAVEVAQAADGTSRGTDSAADPGPDTGSAWSDGSAWDDSGWGDADATRIDSLRDPGHGPPGTGGSTANDTDTVASATESGGTGGHNIGGAYTSRADTGAAPADPSHAGAYFAGAAQPGGPHAGAHGTGGIDVSGLDSGGRDTYMNDSRDPDATGWTPPPSGRPHHGETDDAAYRLAVDDHDPLAGGFPHQGSSGYSGPASYPDPTAGETMRIGSTAPTGPGAGGYGAAPVGGETVWGAPPAAASPAMTAPTVPTPDPSAPGLVAAEPAQTTAPALRLAAAGRTRRGKRGGPNEDAYVVSDGLLAVADGVGGEAAGQIASTLTVTTVAGFRPQYAEDPADGLRQAVARANQVVREKPRQEPSWRGMACTLDVVILGRQQSTGETLFIAHVGDSSVWLQPQKGRPRQVTTPHAIKNGPLLNAIGLADRIEADILREAVRAGDRVILASDGITKVMTPEQLLGLMTELGPEPPERAADALVEAALLAGARDDTTIVVADLVSEPSAR
ncbi:serine/threonine protein phosphatase [Parafrankia soli]|uniref:Serine/threonine protein phosphatase n=1 Tax=Parafrankia soli TaxID=2599596 RepID=A0A1S1R2C7_9ACTN|nr:PP2C family serine/threonine-protein phosphatase [Parafrankia soli]OHV40097.1 serine/threonine protein phosphatase [Parafrankia soli]